MEREWSLFNNLTTTTTNSSNNRGGGQNRHFISPAWDSSHHWTTNTTPTTTTTTPPLNAANIAAASEVHALMLNHRGDSVYAGSQYFPDPHLTCLKLGKRQYFGDGAAAVEVAGIPFGKRGRGGYYCEGGGGGRSGVTVASTAAVPRCQVEGCEMVLVNAKEYHRRHKVCEMHSKAPRVVVLGVEQRFCQQCSRFHSVSEFDYSKRSCRRRLAGHNERRRKGSHDPVSRNHSHDNKPMDERLSYLTLPTGRALSLLSSKNNSWFPSPDLSTRCSAALRELIAENRASFMARQVEDMNSNFAGQSSNSHVNISHYGQMYNADQRGWDRYNEGGGGGGGGGGHVTLDLMQAPSSAFGFMSVRDNSEEEEEQCSEMWRSFGGTHVM